MSAGQFELNAPISSSAWSGEVKIKEPALTCWSARVPKNYYSMPGSALAYWIAASKAPGVVSFKYASASLALPTIAANAFGS